MCLLLWCCRVAIWPPFTFPCTRFRSTQFLSAKFLCFGFASTNHVSRNHIDRNVYGPHCTQCTRHTMTHHTMARHRMTQQPHSAPTTQWPNYHIVHPSPQNDKAYSAPQHGIPNTANLPSSFIQRKFLKLTLLYLYANYVLTGSDSHTLRCKQSLLDLWRDSFHRHAIHCLTEIISLHKENWAGFATLTTIA